MCGIAGILTARHDRPLAPILTAMRAALAHRGPDDGGIAETDAGAGFRLGLAHTRLSIIDLSEAAHQPMTDTATGSWLVYNGEIYNHRELRRELANQPYSSKSDTETLLKGWIERGERLLPSLRGMFAFGLYDARRHRFWLVRDRLGIKPLYVAQPDGETWVFASEVRAILASGLVERRLDEAAVRSYLALGAATAPWTMVEGISSIMPGEAWSLDLSRNGPSKPESKRYWELPPADLATPKLRREEAVERLRPLLLEATGLRMLADVPVSVFLSGGIDSSSLVALLSYQGFRPTAFSIGFDETQYDESGHAETIAKRFGVEHAAIVLRGRDVLGDVEAAVSAYDQPSVDGLNTYFISQAVRRQGIKVALSGLGGDELFAGYPYFRQMARLERPLVSAALRTGSAALGWFRPNDARVAKAREITTGPTDRLSRYSACRGVMLAARRRRVGGGTDGDGLLLPPCMRQRLTVAVAGLDAVSAHSVLDLSVYMANVLLRDTDQMSMAHALETRVPLLDHRLVEEVVAMPGSLKTAAGATSRAKGLLVDALPEPLPTQVVRRKKMGFVLPWERWLRGELRPWVDELLGDGRYVAAAGLDPQGVATVWSEFQQHRQGIRSAEILGLTNLVHWVRQHQLDPPSSSAVLNN